MMKKPWFGPRVIGWGWTPITWQAWVVSATFIVAILAVAMIPGIRYRFGILLALLMAFILVAVITGTKPGGHL